MIPDFIIKQIRILLFPNPSEYLSNLKENDKTKIIDKLMKLNQDEEIKDNQTDQLKSSSKIILKNNFLINKNEKDS